MAHRTIRPVAIAAGAALLTATAALTACGNSSHASTPPAKAPVAASTPAAKATTPAATGSTTVPVTLSEYKINPTVASVPAGHVVFDVTNSGHIKHQFTVIRTDKSAATVLSQHNPNDDIAGARAEIASIAPGASAKLVVKDLKAGHYALVCALPGHYQSGMHADFTVT